MELFITINLYVPCYFPEENWSFSSSEGAHELLFEKHVVKKESLMFLKCCNQEVMTERTKKLEDGHRNFMLVCNSINLT